MKGAQITERFLKWLSWPFIPIGSGPAQVVIDHIVGTGKKFGSITFSERCDIGIRRRQRFSFDGSHIGLLACLRQLLVELASLKSKVKRADGALVLNEQVAPGSVAQKDWQSRQRVSHVYESGRSSPVEIAATRFVPVQTDAGPVRVPTGHADFDCQSEWLQPHGTYFVKNTFKRSGVLPGAAVDTDLNTVARGKCRTA
jgi:hypothetical protein